MGLSTCLSHLPKVTHTTGVELAFGLSWNNLLSTAWVILLWLSNLLAKLSKPILTLEQPQSYFLGLFQITNKSEEKAELVWDQ